MTVLRREACEFGEKLIERIIESVPDAKVTTVIGEQGEFPTYLPSKIIFKKYSLKQIPSSFW